MQEDGLLLYSLNEFREIISVLLETVSPQRVLEVGGEAGLFTRTLVDWAGEFEFEVVVVEPEPSAALRKFAEEGRIRLIEDKSPDALRSAGACDVYLLDGDHNFQTLEGELATIVEVSEGRPFLAVLHDVGWPNAYRDLYYAPKETTGPSSHTVCVNAGAATGYRGVVAWGFRGEGEFAIAREEGGLENGVLAAVDAFLQKNQGFRFFKIPCLFGLGILYHEFASWGADVELAVTPYHENPLLARMEENRLALFLRVLQLQDASFAAERELESVQREQEEEIETLRGELLKLMEALALTGERESPVESDGGEMSVPTSPGNDNLRLLSYDLYRAQVKARRVAGRLKRTLAGG